MSGRRSLLGGVAAALALAPAAAMPAPATSADAELIAMGREARPLIAEYERLTHLFFTASTQAERFQASDDSDPAYERLDELFDQALELRATTLEGFKAKALLLQHGLRSANRMDGHVTFSDPEQEMAWSLVADLLGNGLEGGAA